MTECEVTDWGAALCRLYFFYSRKLDWIGSPARWAGECRYFSLMRGMFNQRSQAL